jgi:hypothetical protein
MIHSNRSEHEVTSVDMATPQWPRTPTEATVFFQKEGVEWFVALPTPLQEMWCEDLLDTYKTFRENAAIACALETKGNELASIFERLGVELEEQGLTFADLRAFELQSQGGSPFSSKAPRCISSSRSHHRD